MLNRQDLLRQWLTQDCQLKVHHMEALKGDASLRKYYRVIGAFSNHSPTSLILMDAKDAVEKTEQFIRVGQLLQSLQVRIPDVYHINHDDGLLLIEDFGHIQLFDILNHDNVDQFYQSALNTLITLQKNSTVLPPNHQLCCFDFQHMLSELQLFTDWFLAKHLQIHLDTDSQKIIDDCFKKIAETIERFPQTIIHRDFHSRNLMVMSNQSLGIIDFQDAMYGPRAYDVVSLLKDCYIVWDTNLQKKYCQYFLSQQKENIALETFWYEFQICGLQRHLKVLGIFARIFYRDNKPKFLADLPQVWNYTMHALHDIADYQSFYWLMKEKIEPLFIEKTKKND